MDAFSLIFVDLMKNRLVMEKINGITLKEFIYRHSNIPILCNSVAERVGTILGKLHDSEIVHGDLTTSNILIRDKVGNNVPSDLDIVLIDFGLGSLKPSVEDKAVDLYVLERAFVSTHPGSEPMMSALIEAYRFGSRKGTIVLSRLLQVRARGRKRDMAG